MFLKKSDVYLLIYWALIGLLIIVACLFFQYQQLKKDFINHGDSLYRHVTQLVGQHDAHLTALSAAALAANDKNHELFSEIANSVKTYYPRIKNIWLVSLNNQEQLSNVSPDQAIAYEISKLASQVTNSPVLSSFGASSNFILIKRSPNNKNAKYALAITFDTNELLDNQDDFFIKNNIERRLVYPSKPIANKGLFEFVYSRVLPIESQRFTLNMTYEPKISELFNIPVLLLSLLLFSMIYWLSVFYWKTRKKTQIALEQVRISALESKLAHASRVNSMGEMASGLAHELTQPLTSILALSQSSKRLLDQGKTDQLPYITGQIIEQVKRGSGILEHFRNWSKPKSNSTAETDLRFVVKQAISLINKDIKSVQLLVDMPEHELLVNIDSVEIEQVVFNLLKNATEALHDINQAKIKISVYKDNSKAVIKISDNGLGIDKDIESTVFAPFVTNKPDGTGLGLSLCQRLVERAGGDIKVSQKADLGGATFIINLPIINK